MQFLAMIQQRNYVFVGFVFLICLVALCIEAGGTSVSQKRVRFSREPVDKVALIGSDVEFACGPSCGDPPANRCLYVAWTHNGTKADYSSRVFRNSNNSLILKTVRYEDEGYYQCVVISGNYGVFLSGRANLKLANLRQLTEEPQDIGDAVVNDAVRFSCRADLAVPLPNISWTHNGRRLENPVTNGRHTILPQGVLQISKLRKSDAGTYSCVVSNVAGTLSSRNATLNISEDATPSSENVLKVIQAPENVTVARGQTAIFECLIQHADDVQWKRIDESPLSLKAYISGGNLFIPDVTPTDEGTYGCVAKVADRTVMLSANLVVDWPPVILKYPEETRRYRGESWRFNCYTSAKPAPEILWYKNGERLRSHGRIKMFPNEQQLPSVLETPSGTIEHVRDLLITSIEVEDTAVYQCLAENYLGSATAAAALVYQEIVEIDAPTNLSASVMPNQRELELSWRPPPVDLTNRSIIFIVHFHESESGSENTMAVKIDSCNGDVCKAICCSNINLSPFTNYTFWVDALLDYHQTTPRFTQPSERIFIRSGDAAATASTPILLQETSDLDKVRLSWNQPSSEPVKGEVTEFLLEMKTDSGSSGGVPVGWKLPVVVPRDIREYVVDGVAPGLVLYFRVMPRTRAGYPTFLPLTNFPWLRYQRVGSISNYGNSTTLDVAPSIETRVLNSSSVLVHWTTSHAIIRRSTSPRLAKWVVLANRANGVALSTRVDVSIEESSVVLHRLSPDTVYQITVYSLMSNEQDGLRAMRLIKTAPSSRLATMPSLSGSSARIVVPYPSPYCESAGPGRLLVSWEKPPMSIASVTLRYSLLPLDDDEAVNVSAQVKMVDTSDSQIMFADLLPGRMYLFAARAQTDSGYKSVFSHDINCSVPLAKPSPPQYVEAVVVNGSLSVWWTVVDPGQGSSEIRMYHVRYSINPVEDNEWNEVSVQGSNTSVVVSNLNVTSSIIYVSVSAENSVGRGDESAVKFARSNSILSTDGSAASLNGQETSGTGATVIVRTSYKEGIIIGGCIAVVCALVSVMVLIFRSRRDQDSCIYRVLFCHRQTGAKFSGDDTCSSGRPNGEVHCLELREMQTLLPQLLENSESDAKGADNGAVGNSVFMNQPSLSLISPDEKCRLGGANQSQWSHHTPYPMAHTSLGIPSSDRTRNALLRHPWILDGGKLRLLNGDFRKKGPVTSSMPNLLDLEKRPVSFGNPSGLLLANGPTTLGQGGRRDFSKANGDLKNGYCAYGGRKGRPRESMDMAPLFENDAVLAADSSLSPSASTAK